MHKISLSEVSQAFSDKLKPKPRRAISRITQNRKWFAATTFVVTVALHSAQAEAQKTTEPGAQAARPVTAAYAGESSRGESRPRQYVDGKNKVSDGKSTNDSRDRLQTLANDLVRRDVDILVASSTAEALAFKNATRTIPIVFVVSSDPVAAGLVDSLAQPGGNITGITTNLTALAGKRLELLKEAVPKISRVAVLWDSQDPSSAQHWKESLFAARELGLQLHSMQVSSADKLDGAFKQAIKERSGALAVAPSPLLTSHPRLITDLAMRLRLPTIFDRRELAANGGLMSYGPDPAEPFRRAALMVDKILKGAKPADMPVERPTKFELVINLKAAKQIGLTISPALLSRAEKVIR